MAGNRRGLALPAILGVVVALALLSSLALFDALQESRVASLAQDQVVARAALVEGVGHASLAPDIAALCVQPPLASTSVERSAAGGGSFRVHWSHLGEGLVRAEVEGLGRSGARARAIALLVPDSSERVSGLYRCPTATRLEPMGSGWLEGHPEG